MSDPMSSHEIEDVLSSIRRLVSEDLRPGAVRVRIPVEDNPDRAEARLILTPALRVIHKAAAEAATRPAGQVVDDTGWDFEALLPDSLATAKHAPQPVAEDSRNDRLRAAATMAFPRASASRPDVFQSRRSEVERVEEEEDEPLFEDAAVLPADPVLVAVSSVPDVMIWEDEAFDEATLQSRRNDLLLDPDPDTPEGLSMNAVALEAADVPFPLSGVIIEPESSAPMWSDMTEMDASWSRSLPAWEGPAPAMTDVTGFVRTELKENPLARAWADRLDETMLAELESEFRDTFDIEAQSVAEDLSLTEVDLPVTDQVFSEDQGLQNRNETTNAAPLPDIEAQVAQELGQIDEDLLRELVREVLREELAGALGERITRNVRKLVRMEINRALSAGEFQ